MENKSPLLISKVLKISFNVIFYLIIISLILFSIANTKLKSTSDIANIGGRGILTVLTSSMDGDKENSFSTEELLFVKLLSNTEKQNLNPGDIITYLDSNIEGLNRPGLITHRIYEVSENDKGEVVYVTLGDAAGNVPQEGTDAYINFSEKYFDSIHYEDVIAVYTGQVKNLGSTMKYIQTPTGFAVTIVLPVFILLIVQGSVLIKNIMGLSKEKLTANLAKEKEEALAKLEAEKERMREQILEELKKEQK
jgi:signal peptidase